MTTNNPPHFPPSVSPQTWLLSSGACPLGIRLARALLAHGDSVVLGVKPSLLETSQASASRLETPLKRAEDLGRFVSDEVEKDEGWKARCRVVGLDCRWENLRRYAANHVEHVSLMDNSVVGQCQAAVADAVKAFANVDVLLCCASESKRRILL